MGRHKLLMQKLELLLTHNTKMGIAMNPEQGGFSIFIKKQGFQADTLAEAIELVPEHYTKKPRCQSTTQYDFGTHRGGFMTLQCEGSPKHGGRHACWTGQHTETWR